jgi:hypothetical protein
MSAQSVAQSLTTVVINPIIMLLFAGGLLFFVWGLVDFLFGVNLSGDHTRVEEGKRHMLYGLLGMFIMASAWALLQLLGNIIGVSLPASV